MRKACPTLLLAFLMACVIACQNKARLAEPNVTKVGGSVESRNTEAVLKMYDQLSKGETDDFIESFHKDARIYGTGFLTRPPQPDSPFAVWLYFGLYPETGRTIDEVVADKDTVMVRLTNSGIDREGTLFRYRGVHTWHLKDGKIVEGWILDDTLEWVIQKRRAKGLDKDTFPWLWGRSPGLDK